MMTTRRARRPPKGCQQEGVGSICPICQMKFPSPRHFHSESHEKIVLKHMMECSAKGTPEAPPKQVTPLSFNSQQGKGDLSPLRSVSLSSSVAAAPAPTGSSDDATERLMERVRKIDSSMKVKCPICSILMYRSQNAHQGGDFDTKVMKHVLKCFARANAGQGDGPRAKTAPPGSDKRNPTKLTPRTTKRLMDGKALLGTKARVAAPAGSVKRTPKDAGGKLGASTHPGSNKHGSDYVQPLKGAGPSPPGNRRPKRQVREIDHNVDANSEAGYSSISDSAPSETASWVSKSKPKAKIKPRKRTSQKKETLKFAPNEDPNHFLNQSWWRTKSTQKRYKKLHAIPFDFQQCMVASITNPPDSCAEIPNPDDKDSRQVARGSKRLKVQAKDQLKLCCPICQKEFKASQGIGYLTEEVMSRHVSKCSEKVFQDNLRQLAVKPMDGGSLPAFLISPDNVVSMANPASQVDVVAQKPIRMSLKEQEDRDAAHAARAHSNYFLMHGEGEQGFMDMLFKNSE